MNAAVELLLSHGSFCFAGTWRGIGLHWLHSFLSEKCFNFMLRIFFGYENYLILQVIFNNSHLNWGMNNQPLLTHIQLQPSSHESCQLCPYPLLFPSKELWCTLWIYNYIVCIWALSCLSNISRFFRIFQS